MDMTNVQAPALPPKNRREQRRALLEASHARKKQALDTPLARATVYQGKVKVWAIKYDWLNKRIDRAEGAEKEKLEKQMEDHMAAEPALPCTGVENEYAPSDTAADACGAEPGRSSGGRGGKARTSVPSAALVYVSQPSSPRAFRMLKCFTSARRIESNVSSYTVLFAVGVAVGVAEPLPDCARMRSSSSSVFASTQSTSTIWK
ncbi:hypothetical protein RI054_31g122640 [Pseudoscourfieldia marina]